MTQEYTRQNQTDGVAPFTMWRVKDETRTPVDAYGRGVLVRAVTPEGGVIFHKDFGRGFEDAMMEYDFVGLFEFCHVDGSVCNLCHNAPGSLRESPVDRNTIRPRRR